MSKLYQRIGFGRMSSRRMRDPRDHTENGHFLKNGHFPVPTKATMRVLKRNQNPAAQIQNTRKFAPREKMNALEALRKAYATPSLEMFLRLPCRVSKLRGPGAFL
jgi:hypothetical protein